MSRVTLPAGQSVRAVAERLGVAPEALGKHVGVADLESPLRAEKVVDLPDGFLRRTPKAPSLPQDVLAKRAHETGKFGGMNAWLALDIEHKRTRTAGGMKAHAASADELAALEEAWHAYERFEAGSNELAAQLFHKLTATHSVDVRAQAYAGEGCAHAQRHLLYGEAAERSRPQALSSAKAALLADPKLPTAHLAMALALRIEGTKEDRDDAREALERALTIDPTARYCRGTLAWILADAGSLDAALAEARSALDRNPECPVALSVTATLREAARDDVTAAAIWERTTQLVPEHANAWAGLSRCLSRLGETERAHAAAEQAREHAKGTFHRERIEHLLLDLRAAPVLGKALVA